jgi:hypothetical protein
MTSFAKLARVGFIEAIEFYFEPLTKLWHWWRSRRSFTAVDEALWRRLDGVADQLEAKLVNLDSPPKEVALPAQLQELHNRLSELIERMARLESLAQSPSVSNSEAQGFATVRDKATTPPPLLLHPRPAPVVVGPSQAGLTATEIQEVLSNFHSAREFVLPSFVGVVAAFTFAMRSEENSAIQIDSASHALAAQARALNINARLLSHFASFPSLVVLDFPAEILERSIYPAAHHLEEIAVPISSRASLPPMGDSYEEVIREAASAMGWVISSRRSHFSAEIARFSADSRVLSRCAEENEPALSRFLIYAEVATFLEREGFAEAAVAVITRAFKLSGSLPASWKSAGRP